MSEGNAKNEVNRVTDGGEGGGGDKRRLKLGE